MRLSIIAAVVFVAASNAAAGEAELRREAEKGLRRAAEFFRKRVSTEGGYLWRYSEDLARREGEAKASASTVWVQPPGTPSVGMAFLAAYNATGDRYYLDLARDAALCLVRGQLRSGGWDYRIEFDLKQRKTYAYRADGNDKGRNVTTLDDDTTQAALRFLLRADKALAFKDAKIHEAAEHGLSSLLKAQYPNGAWPQRYDAFPDPAKHPVKKASFPDKWQREYPKPDYRGFYTLNDNTLADAVETLLEAERVYGGEVFRREVARAGDFLLLAQLPEPQPGWAQQYDFEMRPAWARKFEPPAVTGGESRGAVRTLLRIYRVTGEKKYLEPVPRALDYFRRSRLADGRLARFYEIETNKPLYFTKEYALTYRDDDLPTHYGFKVGDWTDAVAKEYERLKKIDPAKLKQPEAPAKPALTEKLRAQARDALKALDKEGRWVVEGKLRYHGADDPARRVIDTQTFVRNVGILSAYLAASKP